MGNKVVCLDCKKAFSQGTNFKDRREAHCPDCNKPMTSLPHRFRPPKKSEENKWDTVKFLIKNGFYYQHIYDSGFENSKSIRILVSYPENLRDAKEFINRYKAQAIESKNH
jgi:predicted amidophosphoribosyltransferase